MIELENKVILITGATSGIGYNTAMHFASLGARVVGTARQETDLAAALTEAGASAAMLLTADMTCEDQVAQAIGGMFARVVRPGFRWAPSGACCSRFPGPLGWLRRLLRSCLSQHHPGAVGAWAVARPGRS